MSDNWIVQNLENALKTWNEKLAEIWQLITQSPEQFKGGTIWNVIVGIHGAVQAIGLALLVLFFVVGVMKTCGSFAELKRPEHALECADILRAKHQRLWLMRHRRLMATTPSARQVIWCGCTIKCKLMTQ